MSDVFFLLVFFFFADSENALQVEQSRDKQLSVHFTVLKEESVTHSFNVFLHIYSSQTIYAGTVSKKLSTV